MATNSGARPPGIASGPCGGVRSFPMFHRMIDSSVQFVTLLWPCGAGSNRFAGYITSSFHWGVWLTSGDGPSILPWPLTISELSVAVSHRDGTATPRIRNGPRRNLTLVLLIYSRHEYRILPRPVLGYSTPRLWTRLPSAQEPLRGPGTSLNSSFGTVPYVGPS